MNQLTAEQIQELERDAELNAGKCRNCNQTIKIYRYKISKSHAYFMRALANAVRDSGVNDVDISTIGLAYSVRSQVTKLRMHGLIARIKDTAGKQLPRHWLITHKGWEFLNGGGVPCKVVVYNNQVLGHDGEPANIYDILGEVFDPQTPVYGETPVSEPEARVLENVRTPQKYMLVSAQFKGRNWHGRFKISQSYQLQIKHLQIGHPVEITGIDGQPFSQNYKDIAAFQKDWRVV